MLYGMIGIFFIMFVISYKLMNLTAKPKRMTMEKSQQIELRLKRYTLAEYESLKGEDYSFRSRFGYEIKYSVYKSKEISNKYVIIAHGFNYTRLGSIKYALMFLKHNYNVILYCQPNHGLSGGNYTTMGKNEAVDLFDLTNLIIENYGPDIFIGYHGESMGAATALMALKYDPQISFVISDCSYDKLVDELAYQLKKNYKLPKFFIYLASFLTKCFYGYWYQEINLIEVVKNTKVPVLYIHGKNDNFTPYQMSVNLANNTSNKDLFLTEGDHGESIVVDPQLYEEKVFAFIDQNCNISA